MSSSIERYSRAISSSHLTVTDKPGDVDALIAAGWVRNSLATMLYRLRVEFDLIDRTTPVLSNCAATSRLLVLMNCRGLPAARDALGQFVMAQATRAGLNTSTQEQMRLSGRILDLFLDPLCEACHGVKFREVPGTGRLSGVPCGVCDGSGVRRMKFSGGASYAEAEFTRDVQGALARKMDYVGKMMRRFLREHEPASV
jgi:hypothetical protein